MDKPFYETWIDKNGFVWFRIDNQSFRLAYDPSAADENDVQGSGNKYSNFLNRQLTIALGKMEFKYQEIKGQVQ